LLWPVEVPLQDVVEAAVKRGWNEMEVLSALVESAENLMLAGGPNLDFAGKLRELHGRRGG
jgi:hypothetical protein